jgi:hypothetical protein
MVNRTIIIYLILFIGWSAAAFAIGAAVEHGRNQRAFSAERTGYTERLRQLDSDLASVRGDRARIATDLDRERSLSREAAAIADGLLLQIRTGSANAKTIRDKFNGYNAEVLRLVDLYTGGIAGRPYNGYDNSTLKE